MNSVNPGNPRTILGYIDKHKNWYMVCRVKSRIKVIGFNLQQNLVTVVIRSEYFDSEMRSSNTSI